jgi:hypothetical protein
VADDVDAVPDDKVHIHFGLDDTLLYLMGEGSGPMKHSLARALARAEILKAHIRRKKHQFARMAPEEQREELRRYLAERDAQRKKRRDDHNKELLRAQYEAVDRPASAKSSLGERMWHSRKAEAAREAERKKEARERRERARIERSHSIAEKQTAENLGCGKAEEGTYTRFEGGFEEVAGT